MVTVIAVVLPHSEINLMLAVLVPTVTVALVTFTVVPRGRRREVWRGVGLRRAGLGVWPAAIGVPLVLCASAYGVAVVTGVGELDVRLTDATPDWALNLIVSLVLGSVLILGEEIGWRGFLLPNLQRVTGDRRRAALVTGFLHGCFHLPLILIATTYDTGVPRWFAAPAAVAVITAGGIFYAWVWDRSRSVWAVAIAHNTVNTVFDLGAAAVIATGSMNISYVAGETGLATLGVVLVLAVVLWRRARVWHDSSDRG